MTDLRALHAACRLRHEFAGPDGYALAYGSHPAGTASTTSDLDLVLITAQRLSAGQLAALVDAICRLHHDHGLGLDTEVDYAVKVHATYQDVATAVALHCFSTDDDGGITAPAVVVQPWFLNSEPFRLRLLLNALTSPHVFLGGTIRRYDDHRRRAEQAVALLALSLHNDSTITLIDAVAVLTVHADGAVGEDFLGYRPGPHLYGVLQRGLARLADQGILRDRDGQRFECDTAAVRDALARLRTQPVQVTGLAVAPPRGHNRQAWET